MIEGSGIDLVEISRIKKAIEKWGEGFLGHVFTKGEIEYAQKRRFSFEHLAARFATKEAVLKAFGDGKWIDWKNIEIFNTATGGPGVKLHGYLEKIRKKRNISEIVVSMSHTKDYALANALLIK